MAGQLTRRVGPETRTILPRGSHSSHRSRSDLCLARCEDSEDADKTSTHLLVRPARAVCARAVFRPPNMEPAVDCLANTSYDRAVERLFDSARCAARNNARRSHLSV